MSRRLALLRTTILAGTVGATFVLSGRAHAADMDMVTKAPPPAAPPSCVQAVDGVNGKLGGLGGSFANMSLYGAEGSVSAPLGCEFGMQLDAMAGSLGGSSLTVGAGHLFWRNPAEGLLCAYGDSEYWNRFGGARVSHVGPEGELYYGQWTLQGVAGVEFGNNTSATVGSVIQQINIPQRFFDQVNVAYYLQDNFKVYAGQRYLGGRNAAAFGAEWGIPLQHGVMAALFAEGRVGEDDDHGVWGGLRFYFGQKDKTLIRRHREDDPVNWDIDSAFGATNNSTSSPASSPPTTCVGDGCGPPG